MKIKKYLNTKTFSKILALGVFINSIPISSLAGILLEDSRYEAFEGSSITIDNVLEEDKVDVEIEGNTMVNVANQKDLVPITKKYTVEGTNHIPLQGEYDGKARPVIEGNTMYYNNDTGEYSDTFIEGANLSLVSSFEDQLVTQEMVNSGIEKAENLGKYKVEYKVVGKNKSSSQNINYFYYDAPWWNGYSTIRKVNNNTAFTSDLIKVEPNTTYTYSATNKSRSAVHFFKNMDDELPYSGASKGVSGEPFTFTTDSECEYIRIYLGADSELPTNIQLEEGSVATSYEPYKESIKTFYLNSPLLEGDTIEEIGGKIYHVHRYKEILLDGSDDEGWIYREEVSSDIQPNMKWFNFNLYDYSKENVNNKFISNNLPFYGYFKESKNMQNMEGNCFGVNNKDTEYKLFSIKYECLNKAEFLLYLNNNPLAIVYPLETYNYELLYSLDNLEIDSYANGHLNLNTNVPVNKVNFMPTTTNLNYLYPSTEYTVQFESDNKGKIDKISLGDKVLYTKYLVSKGVNRLNITTPSTISSTELILDGIGFNLSNLVVTESSNENFDYFEGMKSVGQDDENGHSIEIVSTNSDKTQSNKIKISLSEPLRSLPNGIKDRIIKRNGQWVVERNCVEVVLDGYRNSNLKFSPRTEINNNATMAKVGFGGEFIKDSNTSVRNDAICDNLKWIQDIPGKASETPGYSRSDGEWQIIINLPINQVGGRDFNDFNNYLKLNPISFVVERKNPIYEPLKTNSIANIFEGTTNISTNSVIPTNLKVIVNRTINRATEAIELAKINPTIANLSRARYWTNLLKESSKKDELQEEINDNVDIVDLQLEQKTTSANLDLYIKCENMLSMSLDTNQISFDDFSGVEDLEKKNAVNITVNSSLPYQLNSYLVSEIQNSDKSKIMDKDILNIRENSESEYKTFNAVNEKLVLKDNIAQGNDNVHNIDLLLKSGLAFEKDIYKATIKFEAEQK